MATRRPLVLINAVPTVLPTGDTLIGADVVGAVRTINVFTATAGQTAFTVPSYTTGQNLVDVYYNGSYTREFAETNSTTVTLSAGAVNGATVVIVQYAPSSGVDLSAYATKAYARSMAVAL